MNVQDKVTCFLHFFSIASRFSVEMFEKGEIAGEKIVEDNVKLKREIVAIEQKQSTITLKIHILVVRVSF